jgi:UDP-N-acetylmuramate--alanine ligase
VITDVFAAGESPIQGADAYAVMQDIHKSCEFLERQNLAKSIREHAQEGDVIVMMGAGDITTVAKELSALLQPACR